VSDQGDFRGSREEKRKEETVMLSAGQLGDMMAAAKSEPALEPTAPASAATASPGAGTETGSKTTMIIAGAAAAVVVILLILYLVLK